MAKTQFYDGQFLTSEFCDSYFGAGASTGHAHTGLDADGSAPLVDISAHTTGQLPYTRISGTEALNFTVASGTFDMTPQYDGISIPFTWTLDNYNRVTLTWPMSADMTGGASIHNSIGYPAPSEIRPDGTNINAFCYATIWNEDQNEYMTGMVIVRSNGAMSVTTTTLDDSIIRLERGGGVYETT